MASVVARYQSLAAVPANAARATEMASCAASRRPIPRSARAWGLPRLSAKAPGDVLFLRRKHDFLDDLDGDRGQLVRVPAEAAEGLFRQVEEALHHAHGPERGPGAEPKVELRQGQVEQLRQERFGLGDALAQPVAQLAQGCGIVAGHQVIRSAVRFPCPRARSEWSERP